MSNLELKVPPVLVLIVASLLMKLTQSFIAIPMFPEGIADIITLLLMLLAVMIGVSSALTFRRYRTTVNPHKPENSSVLVTSGIFKLTRNPMYLSLTFLLAAWAVYQDNLFSLVWLGVFMAYITAYQILPEERVLADKFGEVYEDYKRAVRRWM